MRDVIGFVQGWAVFFNPKDYTITVPALNILITGVVNRVDAIIQCHKVFINFKDAE